MMEFLVEVEGKIYEISELTTSVSFADKLNDGCSKLEFSYIDDNLVIKNGNVVRFKYDNANIFYGYVFKVGRDKSKEITITAYDQLRYCKAKDIIVVKDGETLTSLVKKMCSRFGLIKGILSNTGYVLPTKVHDDKTWLDIIYTAVSDTLMGKGKWYCLRDECGGIALRDIEELKLPLVLGDESLAYNYEYEKSIDETYNQVKVAIPNENTGKYESYIVKDNESIARFGLLQYFELMDKNANPAQAKAKANALLQLYNREVETLELDCLGDVRVRAGCSFYGSIEDIALDKRLIVRAVTHEFLPVHTMNLEVAI